MPKISRKEREETSEYAINVAMSSVEATHARRSSNSDTATNSSSTPKTRSPNTTRSKEVTPAINPSPESVECIDLTQTLVEDFFGPRKERRLKSMRKELEPPSAKKRPAKKKAGLKTTGLDDVAPEEIIVIDSDDDTVPIPYNKDDNDDDDCEVIEVPQANTTARVARASRTRREDKSSTAIDSRPAKRAKVKNEEDMLKKQAASQNPENMDVEGVEVVEATAPVLEAATTVAESAKNTSADDDVVVEGVVNETRLPHMRQHCTRFPFNFKKLGLLRTCYGVKDANSHSCDLCYCYVCDCPVKDCKNWTSSTSNTPETNHCCASDKDSYWNAMRFQEKRKSDKETASGSIIGGNIRPLRGTDDAPPSGWHFMLDCPDYDPDYYDPDYYGHVRTCQRCWCYICDKPAGQCSDRYNHVYDGPDCEDSRKERQKRNSSTYGLRGPFKPDHPDAHLNTDLTKCRHCSWFVSLSKHRQYASSKDWCEVCGRVASEEDLEKQKQYYADESEDESKGNGSYFLGEKEIPFRIQAHDPRLFPKYKANWEDPANSGWNYDAAERDEEVFLHRIGKSPQWKNLSSVIPRVANDKVPNIPDTTGDSCSSYFDMSDATDAIIIEDPKQLELVITLAMVCTYTTRASLAKITAVWDKKTRSGIFKVRLTLAKSVFLGHNSYNPEDNSNMLCLLGSWFGIFPLRPSEICGILECGSSDEIMNRVRGDFQGELSVPPYRVTDARVIDDLHERIPAYIENISNSKDINSGRLTLAPSSGSGRSCTIYSSAVPHSLRDSTARFFSETMLRNLYSPKSASDFIGNLLYGQTRRHYTRDLDTVLGYETSCAADLCLAVSRNYSDSPSSIKDIMIEIENLGHESEDCVEGLNIELLEFQRQSLRWALDREQAPGGVQSFFWSKLPITGEGNGDLYFNPILNLFRKDKPALVRGGFIAEQMGLGKTVISLALILKNPAPEFPLSGSPVSELEKDDATNDTGETSGWEKNLYERTSTANKKTGSVISRGTLVICPVSLVGQWIDEARSKLKDPGLIYPYHGQNRKRDPKMLASNSIVVTTYDILASDAFRKTKNSAFVTDYCPPLQQIRWWRIICDEGHLLRESNTRRSKSVLSLVADHKWIVTGTPMNTSPNDLVNQLKFLGFEHVDKTFKEMKVSRNRRSGFDSELLMYFLRPIMMRHSQDQKYLGTSTTLMSLPPKTVRKKFIKFSTAEKKAFDKIEKESQDWYLSFRSNNRREMSSHFLKLSSKLKPLQMACSGGKCPKLNEGTDTMNAVAGLDSNFVFESKVKKLLKYLKKIRDEEPESKSLVFSQFSSTLDWLKSELPKNGFQFRTLSGDMTMKKRAKALSDFQNDPPTTIFLLSMRSGAVGINLTQANRVFLMEPSFNPALEAQAIGRIHRLGQKRPVVIVRLIMKDSFEERMSNFLIQKYGSKKSEGSSEDDKEDSSDKKVSAQAGNLISDRVKLVTEEFDILFGVKDRLAADDGVEDNSAEKVVTADGVLSMSNV